MRGKNWGKYKIAQGWLLVVGFVMLLWAGTKAAGTVFLLDDSGLPPEEEAAAETPEGVPGPPSTEKDGEKPPAPGRPSVGELIQQLGHPDYWVRESAERELLRWGVEAYEPLLEALTHPDPEIAARARYLLRIIPARVDVAEDSADVREMLGYYESGSPEVRQSILRILAGMAKGEGWPALARLARFERQLPWAKLAALALLAAEPTDHNGRQRFATVIRKHLGDAGRSPANWPVIYLHVRQNPQEGLPRWRQLVTDEQRLLSSQQDQTGVVIVAGLLCLQGLLEADYCEPQVAESTFQRFLQLLLPDHPEHLRAMVDAAVLMQSRGKVDWAETVLSRAIAQGDPRRTLRARRLLAELYYDQDKPLAAAQTLESFLKLVQERTLPVLDVEGSTPGELRSRMYYFFACHFKQVGSLEDHRRYLELALQQDPENIDALIARAQLPEVPEEFQRETAQMIAAVQRELERLLADSTDPEQQASYLNQLAWLVGNSKGDLEKALAWAQRAVELHPESGAYWDTLAHVYYHRGELQKAVEAQSRAAELEPGSRQIRKQLEVFQEALRKAAPK